MRRKDGKRTCLSRAWLCFVFSCSQPSGSSYGSFYGQSFVLLRLRMMDLTQSVPLVDWLTLDRESMEATVERVPERTDIDPLVNEQLIVELYSR